MRPAVVATIVSLISSLTVSAQADQLRTLSHRDRLYDAAASGDSLFVVGHPGRLLRSTDGGKSFESLSVAKHDEALFSISFNAKGEGAVVGRSGFALLTADQGKTWTSTVISVDEEKPSLFGVKVLDDGTIVAVGNFGVIVRSTDHGKTWSRGTYSADPPEQTEAQKALCASDGSSEEDNEGAIEEARLTDVGFADNEHGFAVGEFGLIIYTEDGGKTFKRRSSCTDRLLYGIAVIGPTRALAVGADGAAVETGDGGSTWKPVKTDTTEHLFGVWADAKRAVIVGAAGTLLTRTGGEAFGLRETGVHSWLSSAWLDGKGQGVITGGRAYLLHTSDGGQTQKRTSGE
jgi:photosystem II stability/assembly factor-like uncharacterized protein